MLRLSVDDPRTKCAGYTGAKLFFLPPYSPDLNPIEQVFAKLKTLLRKAAERNVEATWKRIGVLLACFTPQECHFANAGYEPRRAIAKVEGIPASCVLAPGSA